MRERARLTVIGLIVPLLLLCVLALSAGTQANASDVTIDVAIDVNTTGNGDNVLGTTESCNETPLQVGDTIDVDVVVRGIPKYQNGDPKTGIGAFDFDLIFNPAVIEVSRVHMTEGPQIFRPQYYGGTVSVSYNFGKKAEPPGTIGDTLVEMFPDLASIPSGDGVLTRVTLKAVGNGTSRLDLRQTSDRQEEPAIFGPQVDRTSYLVSESDASIVVGSGSCAAPTPTAYQFPTLPPPLLPRTGGPPADKAPGLEPFGLGALAVVASGAVFAYSRRRL